MHSKVNDLHLNKHNGSKHNCNGVTNDSVLLKYNTKGIMQEILGKGSPSQHCATKEIIKVHTNIQTNAQTMLSVGC